MRETDAGLRINRRQQHEFLPGLFKVRRTGHLDDGHVVVLTERSHLGVSEPTDVVGDVEPPSDVGLGDLGVPRFHQEQRVAFNIIDHRRGGH